MRYYFPEKPLFRWFRQKGECTKLPMLSNITLDRAAPKSSGAAPAATAKAPVLAQPEPRRNAGAHAFLDQMEAVHKAYKWLTVAPPPKPQAATPAAAVSLADKPLRAVEPIDLQDMPVTLESNGFKQISATLMRKWFANPKYAVPTQAQKDCAFGAAFYPSGLVDSSSLKHKDLLQYERARLAYEKLKTQEFLESKAARDALQRILRKTPVGTVDIDAALEFGGDLQKMHRKYAFVSITVGKQFPQNFEDIRVEDLEKSRNHTDDLELALGEFRWYAAIDRAHIFYNGRTTRRIQVQSVALYAMAPYGFDDLDNTLEYRGHFNKKNLALVSAGTWVNYPVYMGRDMYAKNAILQPAFNQDFRQWSDKHGQGGDMLLFSERMRPFIQPIDVVVPLEPSPTGTVYWGGAGLDGSYLQPTLRALQNAGISNVYVGLTNTASVSIGRGGTMIDAIRAGLVIRYEDGEDWPLTTGMDGGEGQFNLIGYSYGSLLAAQTASYYSKRGVVVDHLVLIGSPIDDDFLTKLRASPNIKNVIVINLTSEGDDIYAGMPQYKLMNPLFIEKLGLDMLSGKGEGHFYYGHAVPDLEVRLKVLAQFIASKGVR